MKETEQLKKLMEAFDERYYDSDRNSGQADDTRMMFGADEKPEIVLGEVSRILKQFGYKIDIVHEDGSIYGRIGKD